MNISDTIQPFDVELEFWSDDDTALLCIRHNKLTKEHWKHVYDEHKERLQKASRMNAISSLSTIRTRTRSSIGLTSTTTATM